MCNSEGNEARLDQSLNVHRITGMGKLHVANKPVKYWSGRLSEPME